MSSSFVLFLVIYSGDCFFARTQANSMAYAGTQLFSLVLEVTEHVSLATIFLLKLCSN